MTLDTPVQTKTLGADLRALRKARGLTLIEMSEHLGRSVGWLSQVERDMSEPGVTDLRLIAQALDVPVSSLFRQEAVVPHEQGFVVRAGARRPIGSREAGLVEELLSPDLTDDFEMLHSTFEPGAELAEENQRPTQEVGYVTSGRFDICIDGRWHNLGLGDSFRIRGERYRWRNPSQTQKAVVIWVIAPPVY
ncbi:MAG: XRE family transcriptional regulator [Litoreibacter sp.]|nr:XRE family transcriptional regulator [Litoreibacter sp.]